MGIRKGKRDGEGKVDVQVECWFPWKIKSEKGDDGVWMGKDVKIVRRLEERKRGSVNVPLFEK